MFGKEMGWPLITSLSALSLALSPDGETELQLRSENLRPYSFLTLNQSL